MSMKTAALKDTFERAKLPPKPVPTKPKPSTKPTFLSDQNKGGFSLSTNKPIISTNQLSTFKFKNSVKTKEHEVKKVEDDNEISKISLKPPFQRNRDIQTVVKTTHDHPTAGKAPPTDEELKVSNEEEKSAEQIKQEDELKRLPFGSVRDNKLRLFEKLSKEPEPPPRRRRNTSNTSSQGGSFTSSTEDNETFSTFKTKTPPELKAKPRSKSKKGGIEFIDSKIVPFIQSPPPVSNTQDEVYDDVSQQSFPPPPQVLRQPAQPSPEEDQEIYEDVVQESSVITPEPSHPIPKRLPEPHQINPQLTQALPEEDQEIYEDVSQESSGIITPQPSHPIPKPTQAPPEEEQEIYEDVAQETSGSTPQRSPPSPEPIPEEDDIYSDVGDEMKTNATSVPTSRPIPQPITAPSPASPPSVVEIAPLKLEKLFDLLPREKFEIPKGLDQWLKDMLIANRTKLRKLDKNNNNNMDSFIIPPRQPIKRQDLPTETATSKPEETEKERIKREKREKKEKTKKEKEEQRKKEEEKRKRTKELKHFGLSLDEPFKTGGVYMTNSDYTTKDKFHCQYQHGDELIVIQVDKQCQIKGKIVVQNGRNGQVGYVLKESLGITEEEVEPIEQEDEDVPTNSLIPTEDDCAEEMYEEMPSAPPPIPSTPRPQLPPAPSIPVEEEEAIYETV